MSSHQPTPDRPRGRALDADRVVDHLLVHHYIRVLGRRPTAEELTRGTHPQPGKGWAVGRTRIPRTILARHAARLVALLARSRA